MATLLTLLAALLIPIPAQAPGNDYPWPSANMNQISPLRFYYRNCTDYAAWTLNVQLGGSTTDIRFDWSSTQAGGSGHARDWKQGAINRGKPVNDTPKRGAVAWWGSSHGGGYGHVAIVAEILDASNAVVVHEYNRGYTGTFGSRTINRSGDWPQAFLHIADLPDAPPTARRSSTNLAFGPSGYIPGLTSALPIPRPSSETVATAHLHISSTSQLVNIQETANLPRRRHPSSSNTPHPPPARSTGSPFIARNPSNVIPLRTTTPTNLPGRRTPTTSSPQRNELPGEAHSRQTVQQ